MRIRAHTRITHLEREQWREAVKKNHKDFVRYDLTYKVAEELFKQEGLLTNEDFGEKISDKFTQYDIDFIILRISTLEEVLGILKRKYNILPEDMKLTWDKVIERL